MRDRRMNPMRRVVSVVVASALVVSLSAPAFAFDTAIARSALLPGTGQAQNGHYTRAALFAGAAIMTGAGLLATQIHYNRAVDTFENEKRIYNDYPRLLDSGKVFSAAEIDATYQAMETAYNNAEDRLVWRNVFLGALIATYTLNLVDVIMSKPDTGELENTAGLSVEMDGSHVRVVKSFSF